MNRMIVMLVLSFSTALLINGCAIKQPETQIIYVPQRCVIPVVEEPEIDNTSYTDPKDIIAKALKNYTKMKEYAEKLLASQSVCQ